RGWETSFETLPLSELDTLCTIDQYPSDSFIFPAYGCELQISDGLVAAAFASLPQPGQSILILYCVLELTDGEIGALMGMSRSAVQRHRTKTLSELRKQLKALMPKGG
ncbi:MAG: RNA polymerase sigma factor, partial [Butyricicoccus sp.]